MTDTSRDFPGGTEDFWEDRESARKLSPIFANRAYVQMMGEGMLRINFGQITDEGPDYYTAVVVTAHNALAIARLIERYASAMLVPPPPPIITPTAAPAPSMQVPPAPPSDPNG